MVADRKGTRNGMRTWSGNFSPTLNWKRKSSGNAGCRAEEARFAALRAFGNPTLIREQTRAVWTWDWLERLVARHEVRRAHVAALARVCNRLACW